MSRNITRTSAAVGLLFGAASVIAGTRVLAGVDHPAYVVLTWLVEYNVAAGVVGVAAGAGLWMLRRSAVRLTMTLATCHGLVLVILLALLGTGQAVAMDSVRAMMLRTVVWSAIAFVTRRTTS